MLIHVQLPLSGSTYRFSRMTPTIRARTQASGRVGDSHSPRRARPAASSSTSESGTSSAGCLPPTLLSSEEAWASARIRRREAESGCAPRRDEAVGSRAAGVPSPRVCQAPAACFRAVVRLCHDDFCLREPRKERRHSQRTPVMARDAWMYWPRSGAVTTLPGWPFPIGQALPILFGSQRL